MKRTVLAEAAGELSQYRSMAALAPVASTSPSRHRRAPLGQGGVEPGQREQRVPLEGGPLGERKRHVDPEVGAALRDERLGTEQGIHGDLHPAALAHERLLEQRVVYVV